MSDPVLVRILVSVPVSCFRNGTVTVLRQGALLLISRLVLVEQRTLHKRAAADDSGYTAVCR